MFIITKCKHKNNKLLYYKEINFLLRNSDKLRSTGEGFSPMIRGEKAMDDFSPLCYEKSFNLKYII
jgi:hypothetical protein